MTTRSVRSERGAMLIQTALMSVVLIGFMSYVTDYGIYWVSRSQAQNAADASAIAGALARAYDEEPPGAVVTVIADAVARKNLVWSSQPTTSVSFACPPDLVGATGCVRVDVFRDAAHANALPRVLGPVLGIADTQNIRATATARVLAGNTTDCLKPWAIPDKWTENNPPAGVWGPGAQFTRYVTAAPLGTLLPPPQDVYLAPGPLSPGTGLEHSDGDVLTQLVFDPLAIPSPGHIQPLRLPGAKDYAQNIAACNGELVSIGDRIAISDPAGPLPNAANEPATTAGWNSMIDADPAAGWTGAPTNKITNSCAPNCSPLSPRLVAMAVYDVDDYEAMRAANDWTPCGALGKCIRIVNIVGFFLNAVEGAGVADGYLTNYPGQVLGALPSMFPQASFLKAVMLVR